MRRKNPFLFAFLALTFTNLFIFFKRDHFRYQSYASYQSLYQPCNKECKEKWEGFVRDYSTAEFVEAKTISDSVVKGKSSSFEKILSLGQFLRSKFEGQLGQPTTALICSTPLSQFRQLESNKTNQLWCSNFSQMFAFFCWTQNIVCRNIGIMNPGDNHVINECYLPESKQWILVDLTTNILASESKDEPFNLVDFRKAVNSDPKIRVWRSINGSALAEEIDPAPFKSYYGKPYPALFYQSVNYLQKISMGNKIRQYLLPVSWYDILLEKKGNNFLFYLKLALLVLWALSFFVFLFPLRKLNYDRGTTFKQGI